MKRFYKEAQSAQQDGTSDWSVLLDGRTVRTPGGVQLVVSSGALAQAVAEEWQAQETEITPDSMPMMRLTATCLDRVAPRRAEISADIVAYAASDLLSYRAETGSDLRQRQDAVWSPWLDWAAARLGIGLIVTDGIMPVEQTADALAAAERHVAGLTDFELTVLALAVPAAGSFVLGAAFVVGALTAAELFAVSQLDETWQIEQWGEDYEAADRRAALAAEFDALERYLRLSRA